MRRRRHVPATAIIGQMPILRSALDPTSDAFRVNSEAVGGLVEELRARTRAIAERGAAGDDASIARHRERGKLPVRERIERLIDTGSAFLELSPLAANGLYDGEAPGAGIVTGIAMVEGVECVLVANDATVKGGTYFPMTVKKHLRAQEIALENRLPASISSTREVPSCRSRTRCSRIASTSAGSSTTRRSSPREGSRRSHW